jgi:hypothetical protein
MKLPIVCWGEAEEVGALDESVPVDGLAEPDVLDPSPEATSAAPEEAAVSYTQMTLPTILRV